MLTIPNGTHDFMWFLVRTIGKCFCSLCIIYLWTVADADADADANADTEVDV